MPDSAKRASPADQVSEATTARLSIYLHCLEQLAAAGVVSIASSRLAARFGLNAAQFRKDLAHFGELGVRGVGYDVAGLRRHLRQILGLDRGCGMAILGAGNLGLALADYHGFRERFRIVALFDNDPAKVGRRTRGGVGIRHVDELPAAVRHDGIDIAVVAVPGASAQRVIDGLVGCGIRAILNFAPGALRVPPDVKLKSVDFTVSLESLSFFLASEPHGHDT